jgi:hypothetical protein
MRMNKVLCGVAVLPLLFGIALAETPKQSNDSKAAAKQPIQLSEKQMDQVSAGFKFLELDVFNTGFTVVSVYQAPSNTIICPNCYLLINNFALSVASQMGPGGTPAF